MIKNFSKLDNFVNKLFLAVLSIYIFSFTMSRSVLFNNNPTFHFIVAYAIKLCLILILMTTFYHIVTFEFTVKYTILLIVLGLLILANYYFTREGAILLIYCFTICAKNYNPDKLFKLIFFVFSISFLFVLFCRIINVMPDVESFESVRGNGVVRHSLGFATPNVSAYYITAFSIMYMNYKREKLAIYDFIFLLVFSIVLYKFSDTKNGLFASILAIILGLICRYVKTGLFLGLIEKFSVCSFVLAAIIPFLLTHLYVLFPSELGFLNGMLSGRLGLQEKAFDKFGVTVIGQRIIYNVNEYDKVDSSIVDLLLTYGIIAFILVIVFFTYEAYLACKLKNKWLCMCFIVVAYYGIFESSILTLIFNPFSLYFFDNVFKYFPESYIKVIGREVVKVI